MSDKKYIATYDDLCQYLGDQMETGVLTDWPFYEGELGHDSSGGTDYKTLAKLNRKGILTLDSQEGFCSLGDDLDDYEESYPPKMLEEISRRYPCIGDHIKGYIGEVQRSYLQFCIPFQLISDALPELIKKEVSINKWNRKIPVTNLVFLLDDGSQFEYAYTYCQPAEDWDRNLSMIKDHYDLGPSFNESIADQKVVQLSFITNWCPETSVAARLLESLGGIADPYEFGPRLNYRPY